MSNKHSETSDDLRFERLVDGELSPNEYCNLLTTLDDEPGGWRRCALAFLEAQALARELGQARNIVDSRPETSQREQVTAANRRNLRGNWEPWSLLAIAASFVAAFALGIVTPKLFVGPQQEGTLAGNFSQQQPHGDQATQVVPYQTLRPIGNVRVVMDGGAGGSSQAGQLPVYEASRDADQWLADQRPVLGPELIELLRREGYDVRHEQQYYPAPLDDGREVIVPVEGYQITPVGRTY